VQVHAERGKTFEETKMSTELHPAHLDNARSALLRRFRDLNTPPNGTAKLSLFFEQMTQYRGGYFEAARQQLVREQCIEMLTTGFMRLTPRGYATAHG
jgi:hypothetical protein